MITVGVVGASGYAGGELVRLLSRHPQVKINYVVSGSNAGQPLSRALPGLAGTPAGALACETFDVGRAAQAADVLFLAQESGAAMRAAPELLDLKKRVIDLSADFRLRDVNVYEKTYQIEHLGAQLLDEGRVAYGLPETNRVFVQGAYLVANPGCYPTATILALAPLLAAGLIETKNIVVDAKSGISGAGRSRFGLDYHYAEANEAVKAYNLGGSHRHVPEIEQELSVHAAPANVSLTFSPHLVPMTRGLLATCYGRLTNPNTTTEQVLDTLRAAYADAPFVIVRDADEYPSTKNVQGSNFCHIGAKADARTGVVTVVSAIDNLVKGAAGQAIQNMNLMLDLPETLGLEAPPTWP